MTFARRHTEAVLVILVVPLSLLIAWQPFLGWALVALACGAVALVAVASAAKPQMLYAVLLVLLLPGFFNEPFTSGNLVFWVQQVLLIAVLLLMLTRRGVAPSVKLLALSLGILVLVTLPVSLSNESPLFYLNGLRRLAIAPMMFLLGQCLWTEASSEIAYRVLVWTMCLQLPASVIVAVASAGSLLNASRDALTGTFGHGASGVVGVYLVAVLSIMLLRAARRGVSFRSLIPAIVCFVILGSISEITFLYILMPAVLLVVVIISFLRSEPSRRAKTVVLTLVGVVVLIGSLSIVFTNSSNRWSQGTMKLSNLLDVGYYRRYLAVDNGGILNLGGGKHLFTRYGAMTYAWAEIRKSPVSQLTGMGMGSASAGVLGASATLQAIRISGLNSSTLSILLYEVGLGGSVLYLLPVFAYVWKALLSVLRATAKNAAAASLASEMLLIYGICVLASLIYCPFLLFVSSGGTFWLLAGLWAAEQPSGGAGALAMAGEEFSLQPGISESR